MRLPLLFFSLAIATAAFAQAKKPEYSDSVRFSCFDRPYLSVSVHAPGRRSFPDIQLQLTDQYGRRAGIGKYDRRIPNSHYGKVAEIPKAPERSKAVAIEVCGATAGRYAFTVVEHDSSPYIISVTGDDGRYGNQSDDLDMHPNGARVCQYRFYFSMAAGNASIEWVDKENRPLPFSARPACDPAPRF